jgi:hypothetical protein
MCEATLAVPSEHVDQSTPSPTLGDILREYGPAYRRKYASRMSRDQLKALEMLACCRTGALGSAVYFCEGCEKRHHVPQSCGNRHCRAPIDTDVDWSCQGEKAKQWLEDQLANLLPGPYFLVTFTVPKEIRRFVRSHPRQCYAALLDAAAATLMQLAQNPKYVGPSTLGFTGVLHILSFPAEGLEPMESPGFPVAWTS